MQLDYGYRQDLKGFSAIIPQGQQQMQQMPQQGQQGQQPYIMPQQGAPGAMVPPRVGNNMAYGQPGGVPPAQQGYYPVPYGYQQQQQYVPNQGQQAMRPPQQAPAYGTYAAPIKRQPTLPSGYYGDNDESYEIIVSPEQIEREASENEASKIVLPENLRHQQQPQNPVVQNTKKNPNLPDINKIYSNAFSDADENYNIPQGYESQSIDNFNTFYSY